MRWLFCLLAVAALLIGALTIAVALANRAAYTVAGCFGGYCKATPGLDQTREKVGRGESLFSIDNFCWPSGLVLQEGRRYRITVTMPADGPDWFDYSRHTDVEGYPIEGPDWVHISATPIKRWWGQNWFKPIARIGARGNDEYPLDPVVPLPPLPPGVPHGEVVPVAQSDHFEPIDKASAEAAPRRMDRKVLVAEITARSTGELFLYVNDAAWAFAPRLFYTNNYGFAQVTIEPTL